MYSACKKGKIVELDSPDILQILCLKIALNTFTARFCRGALCKSLFCSHEACFKLEFCWRATVGLCYLMHVYVICLARWTFLISKTQSLFQDYSPVLRVVNTSQHTVFDQQMFSGGDKDLDPPFLSYFLSATSDPAGLCLCSTSSCVELLSSPSSSSLSLLSSLVS